MAKFDYRSLSSGERTELLQDLWSLLDLLAKKGGTRDFLSGFLTPSERVMFARRLRVATYLLEGKRQEEICEELGVGVSTIQTVDRWLERAFGDRRKDLSARLAEARRQKKRRTVIHEDIRGSFDDVRHRYPGHFLFMNWILDGME